MSLVLFAQFVQNPPPGKADASGLMAAMLCPLIFVLVFAVAIIASFWRLFEKAGQPGWASLIPFYNMYVLTCKVARKEIVWFLLQLVPLVNVIAAIVVTLEVARKFRKSDAFAVGLLLLPLIFYPILAFGDAKYRPGKAAVEEEFDDEE